MKLKPNAAAAWLAAPLMAMMMVACGDDGSSAPEEEDAGTDTAGEADCGNGEVEGDEECDDGDTNDNNACSNECTLPEPGELCGNGEVDGEEACDNGASNGRPGNDCTDACEDNVCGDGHRGSDEDCDDGDRVDTNDCTNDCTAPAAPVTCGDGDIQGDEECDEGGRNGQNGSACTAGCTEDVCGNGQRGEEEECDDGDRNDTNDCSNECTVNVVATCGNGEVEDGEDCDDGNSNGAAGSACTATCLTDVCGNGQRGPDEECDDGDRINTDECSNDCTAPAIPPTCGDGNVDTDLGEDCDEGEADNGTLASACTEACQDAICGDGMINNGEGCDNGPQNGTNGNACTSDCAINECGDGHRGPGETCDEGEGNSDEADATCTTECAAPGCGDGVVQTGEECDEGDANADTATAACTEACTEPTCGDGIQQTGEQCDDGSNNSDVNANHCRTDCSNAACGDGVIDSELGEECDLGEENGVGGVCTSNCNNTQCGDGIVQDDEECDDANTNNNDSCLTNCQFNACGDGAVYVFESDAANPNEIEDCDDANEEDGDSCLTTCEYNVCSDNELLAEITEPYADPDGNGPMTASRAGRGANTANGAIDCSAEGGQQVDCANATFHSNDSGTRDFSPDGLVLASGAACTGAGVACFPKPLTHETAVANESFFVTRVMVETCDDGNVVNTDACVALDTNGDGVLECSAAACGDGVVQTGVEDCDDQDTDNNDSCLDTCETNTCGDGWLFTVNAGANAEECDDGNNVETDLCGNDCELLGVTDAGGLSESCGDGVVQPGEGCDHGGTPTATCNASCRITTCGNGTVDPGEQCDDGNAYNNDQCLNSCRWNVCGDGFRYTSTSNNPTNNQSLEQCDDANSNENDACTSSCVWNGCGDGAVYTHPSHLPGALVNDGSRTGINGPSIAVPGPALPGGGPTTPHAACGNIAPPTPGAAFDDCTNPAGNAVGVEECDDSNAVNGDGCNSCQISTCGDGTVDLNEDCDDGNVVSGDGCEADCSLPPSCGDGVRDPGEACDGTDFDLANGVQAGTDPNVTCLLDCKLSTCGNGVNEGAGTTDEECDDGNTDNGDSCTNRCLEATCGDGIVQLDGFNEVNEAAETLPVAFGVNLASDDEECDDGNDIETDGCTNTCRFNVLGDGIRYTGAELEANAADPHACDTGVVSGDHPRRHPDRANRVSNACAQIGVAAVSNCDGDGYDDETDFCGAWNDPTPANRGVIRCAPAATARGITAWKSGDWCLMPALDHGQHDGSGVQSDLATGDWYEAKAYCESYGLSARLAVVTTAENRTILADMAEAADVAGLPSGAVDQTGMCVNSNDGAACTVGTQVADCDSDTCEGICAGGSEAGTACLVDGDCAGGGTCGSYGCVDSDDGTECTNDGDCDSNECQVTMSWIGLFDDFTGSVNGGTPVSTNPGRWYWLDETLDNPTNNTTRLLWKHTAGPPVVLTHPQGNGDCGVLDQGTNDAVAVGTEGWDDVGCGDQRAFMCEFPLP